MDPVTISTLAVASLAASVAGGVTSFIGAQQQAAAQKESFNYQAQVARNNQIVAQQNAQQAAAAGAVAGQARDLKTRAVVGAITAGQGASGIDTGSDSSREVRQSAENLGRLDTATIVSNAMQQVRGYQAQGVNFEAQVGLDTISGRNASTAGNIASFSSLLGGATSFSDKWLRFQTAGVNI